MNRPRLIKEYIEPSNQEHDEYLRNIVKRSMILDLIKKLKSPKAKKDRYKQLKKLNQKIELYEQSLIRSK